MSSATSVVDTLIGRIGSLDNPFEVILPDGSKRVAGGGDPKFTLSINNERAIRAIKTLDEANIAEAYLRGDIDLEGDMIAPFTVRSKLDDRHPLVEAWRYIQPFLFGQVYTNKQAIKSHYDLPPDLFLSFLDPQEPAYSQGVYQKDDEGLDTALARKFKWAIKQTGIKKGTRVLEIGPGWGAFARHALDAGADFTGVTISQVSKDFIEDRLHNYKDRVQIDLVDIYEYEPEEQFDVIVIMGVIEHLPDYARVLKKFDQILKPGGKVFLDGSAARKKYELSTFMVRHIYPGNHSFLVLDDFINKLHKSPFELLECHNDTHSYFLTFVQWAKNLDSNKEEIIERFGEFEFRKFRLYLWGATWEFLGRTLECYRTILHKPAEYQPPH